MQWSQTYNAYALLKQWDDTRKLVALPLFLTDAARETFNGLPEETRADWNLTCNELTNIFAPDDDSLEKRFWSRRQRDGETIATYAAALRALSIDAFPHHNAVTKEQQLLRQFFRGLHSQVAEETARKCPRTLNEAVMAAQNAIKVRKTLEDIRLSAMVQTAQNTEDNQSGQSCVAGRTSNSEMEELRNQIQQLTETVRQLGSNTRRVTYEDDIRRLPRSSTPPPRRMQLRRHNENSYERLPQEFRVPNTRLDNRRHEQGVRCFECNGRGHVARECRGREQGVRCYECDGRGHIARECPNRVRNAQLNSDKRWGN